MLKLNIPYQNKNTNDIAMLKSYSKTRCGKLYGFGVNSKKEWFTSIYMSNTHDWKEIDKQIFNKILLDELSKRGFLTRKPFFRCLVTFERPPLNITPKPFIDTFGRVWLDFNQKSYMIMNEFGVWTIILDE